MKNGYEEEARQVAERELSMPLSNHLWKAARIDAARKIARIVEREGDEDGTRGDPAYLGMVAADLIRESIVMREVSA